GRGPCVVARLGPSAVSAVGDAERVSTGLWHADCTDAHSVSIPQRSPMKSLLTPLTAAAMLAFAPQLNAQEPAPPASPPAQPPSPDAGQSQAEVSDQDLETFADIYIELEETLSRYEEEL